MQHSAYDQGDPSDLSIEVLGLPYSKFIMIRSINITPPMPPGGVIQVPGILLQRLEEEVQWRPLVAALSQSMSPQAQLAEFAEEPSVTAQAGILLHLLCD